MADKNGAKLRKGNVVFNTKSLKFGRYYSAFSDMPLLEIDEELAPDEIEETVEGDGGDSSFMTVYWRVENTLKVTDKTPQGRLALQLKYASPSV